VAVPYSNEDPLEVYRYFSTFIKSRDELAGVDDAGEAILQKITYMLEKEAGAHVEMLRKLIVNLDVDNCDVSRLDYLAFILGIPIPGDWTDEIRRQYLRQLPDLLKIKGTHLNFAKQAAFHDHSDVWLVELWKRIENEYRSYRREPDATHTLKSARVDMLSCATSCESICESICESGFQLDGDYVQPSAAEQILAELGEVLPVHVVLRRQAEFVEPNEAFYPSYDTLGCWSYCESWCEDACESDTQVWPGSYTESDFRDLGPVPQDRWAYETICITICESICQTCCECGQEGTCATLCEVTCQVLCASVCQSSCMQACQTDCQGVSCQVTCAASCQETCQSVCVDSCESLCEADLEP
jgi:hypothetical protein